ncbi:sucrase ferredoxin [Leptothoe sp. EHU-05/26/07-4]|uniref:Sucrase ferredoxin n=1 Tax=Adonisia turfae CCMR0081 TaxID=2292702 RepID=A0A6M0RIH3_9CYAN|nr:sucrase ferredoxin [Adonisia turfae]NEZ56036.1 hypothetical protein [Adonisia turfae CCMR0081]
MQTATLTRSKSLIGTAVPANTFILLEVPPPWDKPALLSSGVPESLRKVVRSLLVAKSDVRVHLIANEESGQQQRRRILIFRRACLPTDSGLQTEQVNTLVKDYGCWDIQVESPDDMAIAIDDFFQQKCRPLKLSSQRHLMVCTHASHNECCGMYGYPFYRDAIATVQQLGLSDDVKLWQVSHIGGHRFAPTLIDFPQGRYYGNLNQQSLMCLLKQSGNMAPLLSTYRGWSLLPKPLQRLEAELWRHHGWSWMQSQVFGQILKQSTAYVLAELTVKLPGQNLLRYIAEVQNNQLNCYPLGSLVGSDMPSFSIRLE